MQELDRLKQAYEASQRDAQMEAAVRRYRSAINGSQSPDTSGTERREVELLQKVLGEFRTNLNDLRIEVAQLKNEVKQLKAKAHGNDIADMAMALQGGRDGE